MRCSELSQAPSGPGLAPRQVRMRAARTVVPSCGAHIDSSHRARIVAREAVPLDLADLGEEDEPIRPLRHKSMLDTLSCQCTCGRSARRLARCTYALAFVLSWTAMIILVCSTQALVGARLALRPHNPTTRANPATVGPAPQPDVPRILIEAPRRGLALSPRDAATLELRGESTLPGTVSVLQSERLEGYEQRLEATEFSIGPEALRLEEGLNIITTQVQISNESVLRDVRSVLLLPSDTPHGPFAAAKPLERQPWPPELPDTVSVLLRLGEDGLSFSRSDYELPMSGTSQLFNAGQRTSCMCANDACCSEIALVGKAEQVAFGRLDVSVAIGAFEHLKKSESPPPHPPPPLPPYIRDTWCELGGLSVDQGPDAATAMTNVNRRTIGLCTDACDADRTCHSLTWNRHGKECYLKALILSPDSPVIASTSDSILATHYKGPHGCHEAPPPPPPPVAPVWHPTGIAWRYTPDGFPQLKVEATGYDVTLGVKLQLNTTIYGGSQRAVEGTIFVRFDSLNVKANLAVTNATAAAGGWSDDADTEYHYTYGGEDDTDSCTAVDMPVMLGAIEVHARGLHVDGGTLYEPIREVLELSGIHDGLMDRVFSQIDFDLTDDIHDSLTDALKSVSCKLDWQRVNVSDSVPDIFESKAQSELEALTQLKHASLDGEGSLRLMLGTAFRPISRPTFAPYVAAGVANVSLQALEAFADTDAVFAFSASAHLVNQVLSASWKAGTFDVDISAQRHDVLIGACQRHLGLTCSLFSPAGGATADTPLKIMFRLTSPPVIRMSPSEDDPRCTMELVVADLSASVCVEQAGGGCALQISLWLSALLPVGISPRRNDDYEAKFFVCESEGRVGVDFDVADGTWPVNDRDAQPLVQEIIAEAVERLLLFALKSVQKSMKAFMETPGFFTQGLNVGPSKTNILFSPAEQPGVFTLWVNPDQRVECTTPLFRARKRKSAAGPLGAGQTRMYSKARFLVVNEPQPGAWPLGDAQLIKAVPVSGQIDPGLVERGSLKAWSTSQAEGHTVVVPLSLDPDGNFMGSFVARSGINTIEVVVVPKYADPIKVTRSVLYVPTGSMHVLHSDSGFYRSQGVMQMLYKFDSDLMDYIEDQVQLRFPEVLADALEDATTPPQIQISRPRHIACEFSFAPTRDGQIEVKATLPDFQIPIRGCLFLSMPPIEFCEQAVVELHDLEVIVLIDVVLHTEHAHTFNQGQGRPPSLEVRDNVTVSLTKITAKGLDDGGLAEAGQFFEENKADIEESAVESIKDSLLKSVKLAIKSFDNDIEIGLPLPGNGSKGYTNLTFDASSFKDEDDGNSDIHGDDHEAINVTLVLPDSNDKEYNLSLSFDDVRASQDRLQITMEAAVADAHEHRRWDAPILARHQIQGIPAFWTRRYQNDLSARDRAHHFRGSVLIQVDLDLLNAIFAGLYRHGALDVNITGDAFAPTRDSIWKALDTQLADILDAEATGPDGDSHEPLGKCRLGIRVRAKAPPVIYLADHEAPNAGELYVISLGSTVYELYEDVPGGPERLYGHAQFHAAVQAQLQPARREPDGRIKLHFLLHNLTFHFDCDDSRYSAFSALEATTEAAAALIIGLFDNIDTTTTSTIEMGDKLNLDVEVKLRTGHLVMWIAALDITDELTKELDDAFDTLPATDVDHEENLLDMWTADLVDGLFTFGFDLRTPFTDLVGDFRDAPSYSYD